MNIASSLSQGQFDPIEIELIRMANMYMNTLRLAKIKPEWDLFKQTEQYRNLKTSLLPSRLRLLEALWKLISEVMRNEADVMSVAYAIAYRVKAQAEARYAKSPKIHPELYDLPPDHQKKIEDTVKRLFTDIDKN